MENFGTYFEIPVLDMDRAVSFYSAVFECEFSRDSIHGNEMAFFPFYVGSPGITGALAKGETYRPTLNGSLIYIRTADIAATLARALAAGGTQLFPKTEVSGLGFSAEFKDSEGNRIALFQRA